MEKKYLMLIPLAIPLFFGGKAAVTAIKRKTGNKSNGHGNLSNNAGTTVVNELSGSTEIEESDKHIDEMRDVLTKNTLGSEVSTVPIGSETVPYEDISTHDHFDNQESKTIINADTELPGEDEPGRMTLRGDTEEPQDPLEGRQIFTGPKGGKYFINDAGKKIYLKGK